MIKTAPVTKMPPPFIPLCHFRIFRSLWIVSSKGSSLCPVVPPSDGKDTKMKLKVRYENMIQEIELDPEEVEQLWITFSLEGDELTPEQRAGMVQQAWEEQFNRPDYNSWHKYARHCGDSMVQKGAEEDEEETEIFEPLMKEVADDRIFRRDEIVRNERDSYEATCQWIKKRLAKKSQWADAFIAIRIDGISVNDYAASIGLSDASIVSKWLSRAKKKLRKEYLDRQKNAA